MNDQSKIGKLKQYNVQISRLIKLILELNESHQKALLKKGKKLLLKENRAHRKACRIPVKYATFDRIYSDNIMNISQSGVFIETKRPIFIGEEILINFMIEGLDDLIKIKGEVVNASRLGIGIEFKDINPGILNNMKALLEKMKE
jgi:Tfp pilus assembly protein PilZ